MTDTPISDDGGIDSSSSSCVLDIRDCSEPAWVLDITTSSVTESDSEAVLVAIVCVMVGTILD